MTDITSNKLKAIIENQLAEIEKNKDKIDQERNEAAKNNRSCLSHWFPVLQALGITVPETKMYPISIPDQFSMIDGTPTESVLKVIEEIKNGAKEFGYPVFIKNSLFSDKHDWKESCFVENENQILGHIRLITDMAYAVGCDEALYLVLRKMIPVDSPFSAFRGMPITAERRYFVKDGKVIFHHPYFPPQSIQNPSISNWQPLLDQLNQETPEEITLLKTQSEKIGSALCGFWSVDWLKSKDGTWFCIDMALGHRSYCWEDYPNGTVGL